MNELPNDWFMPNEPEAVNKKAGSTYTAKRKAQRKKKKVMKKFSRRNK